MPIEQFPLCGLQEGEKRFIFDVFSDRKVYKIYAAALIHANGSFGSSDAPATLTDWRGALVLVKDYLSASYYLCFLGLSSDSNTGYQDFEVELSRTSELIPCSSGHSNIVMDGVYRDDVGLSQHVHIRDLFQTRFLRYIRIPLYMFNSLMTMKHLR